VAVGHEIAVADSTGSDPDQDLVSPGFWQRAVFDLDGPARAVQDGCPHPDPLSLSRNLALWSATGNGEGMNLG
jgi:hypothetical protein